MGAAYPIRRGRPNRLNAELGMDAALFDSDGGSRLPALGVTKPPPSTAIGMINSRGLFLIGAELLLTAAVDDSCVGVVHVSGSDSIVD